MTKKIGMFIIIAVFLTISGLGTVGSAHAQQNSFQPSTVHSEGGGWNWWGWWQWWLQHHHVGPPGDSDHPGHGHHVGPPGKSDHPDGDHDGDDKGKGGKGKGHNHGHED